MKHFVLTVGGVDYTTMAEMAERYRVRYGGSLLYPWTDVMNSYGRGILIRDRIITIFSDQHQRFVTYVQLDYYRVRKEDFTILKVKRRV